MSMNFFKIFRASVRDAGGGGSRNGGWLKEASMTVTLREPVIPVNVKPYALSVGYIRRSNSSAMWFLFH